MTIQRMIELLEIEHECMLRGAHDACDRNCADCELVQDDGELHEMYASVIALLKEHNIRRDGRWKSLPYKKARVCSVCEADEPYKFADDDADVYAYCPHCGAKMEGR